MKLHNDLVVLDLEANAKQGRDLRITEIGAVRLNKDFEIVDEYTQLVNPEQRQSSKAIRITGILDYMLAAQPLFGEAASRFETWCGPRNKYQIAAWGNYYDIPALREEYRRVGKQYGHVGFAPCIKSICWAWLMFTRRPSSTCTVPRVAEKLGIPWEGQEHRALVDARMEAKCLQKVAKESREFWPQHTRFFRFPD